MAHSPLGRTGPAARQIESAVEFIRARRSVPRVSLVAHSWGTMPAAFYAGQHPERVERLVQFGPVTQRNEPRDTTTPPAHWVVTQEDQRARFYGYVPKGEPPLMTLRHFAEWGPAYMASDTTASTRVPPGVDVPSGPLVDAEDAWSGHLSYDPAKITAPVLIVRGEWDVVTTDADARWLYDAMSRSPIKRDVKINRGSHVMHLETSRRQLYQEVSAFLSEADVVEPSSGDRGGRWIHLGAFGALSGPLRSFGVNSWAALRAVTDSINQAGGVHLGDGSTGYFRVSYQDDRCEPTVGIRVVREIAVSDALVAIGPSCSGVAEPLYATLRRSAAGSDSGLEMPVFTDGATKAGLASISEWVFRNTPNERDMYRALWAWVKQRYPALRTIYGGQEADFAHSHDTWENIIRPEAVASGFTVTGEVDWSVTDTALADAAAAIEAAHPDILVISGHAPTTCGVLKSLARRGIHAALVVGLTSAASPETLERCGSEADGLLIPTSFVSTTPQARAAAALVRRAGGTPDLHSMAAWEIVLAIKQVVEKEGIVARTETLTADRRKLRDGLARLATIEGLLGPIARTPDRESRKPFVIVQAHRRSWKIVK